MKKLITVAAIALVALTACKSIKLEKVERTPLADGTVVENAIRGEYYAYGLQNNLEGLEIDYTPTSGVHVAINKVSYDMSARHAEIVDKSLTGATSLASAIGAAIATAGGKPAADGISALVKRFVDAGGDATKAKVVIGDGVIECTDGSCREVCTDGSCWE